MRADANFDPAARGYRILYRNDVTNHCPGCGHTHWYVGRNVAECAHCTVVLPLALHTVTGAQCEPGLALAS